MYDVIEEKRAFTSRNRTRLEILASILDVARHGAIKTHIMYKANLSHRQLEKYLTFLIGKGLLADATDPDTDGHWYEATENGLEFLKDFSKMESHLTKKTA